MLSKNLRGEIKKKKEIHYELIKLRKEIEEKDKTMKWRINYKMFKRLEQNGNLEGYRMKMKGK